MRSDRRRLVQAGFLVLTLGAAQIARGANMLAVRVWLMDAEAEAAVLA